MIKQIKFKNIYSFKEEAIIDFRKKDKLRESEEYVYSDGKNDYLKFLITYGKNNVGKTNLLKVIQSFYSFIRGNSSINFKPLNVIYNDWSFFTSKNEPIEYEIILTNNINNNFYEYRYGFSFNNDEILTEYLFVRTNGKQENKIFEKNPENKNNIEQIISKNNFSSSPGLFVNLPKNKLLLPIAANVGETNSAIVISSLIDKIINVNFNMPNNVVFDIPLSRLEQNQVSEIVDFIHDIDISIDGIKFKEQSLPFNLPFNNGGVEKVKVPFFIIGDYEIPIEKMSLGTKKIINYFSLILDKINHFKTIKETVNKDINLENFLFVIDEFDSGLHPTILKSLIKEILNKIKKAGFEKNIQLFLTTHNPLLLGDEDLRRDQIIFIEKNEKQSSYIVGLGDQSIRKDLNLSKAYMEGKLGGIPNIKNK